MKCWICQKNEADSGEHVIMRYAFEKIIGKPSRNQSIYVNQINGRKNIPVKSFKNDRFKFPKSICSSCNGTLTQPYDDAFRKFIDYLWKCKTGIVLRNKIVFSKMTGTEKQNLALYFLKVFGCLIVENKAKISENEFQLLRCSLLGKTIYTQSFYFSAHRDLSKLAIKKGVLAAQLPCFTSKFITWTIDLDWISFVLSFQHIPPEKQYGSVWRLDKDVNSIVLGKLS